MARHRIHLLVAPLLLTVGCPDSRGATDDDDTTAVVVDDDDSVPSGPWDDAACAVVVNQSWPDPDGAPQEAMRTSYAYDAAGLRTGVWLDGYQDSEDLPNGETDVFVDYVWESGQLTGDMWSFWNSVYDCATEYTWSDSRELRAWTTTGSDEGFPRWGEYEYDAFGWPTSFQSGRVGFDPNVGAETTYTRDQQDRVLESISDNLFDGGRRRAEYDERERIAVQYWWDDDGWVEINRYLTTYDAVGRPVEIESPANSVNSVSRRVWTFTYGPDCPAELWPAPLFDGPGWTLNHCGG